MRQQVQVDSATVNNINERRKNRQSRVNRSQFNYAKTVEITVNILFSITIAKKITIQKKQQSQQSIRIRFQSKTTIQTPIKATWGRGRSIFRFVFPCRKVSRLGRKIFWWDQLFRARTFPARTTNTPKKKHKPWLMESDFRRRRSFCLSSTGSNGPVSSAEQKQNRTEELFRTFRGGGSFEKSFGKKKKQEILISTNFWEHKIRRFSFMSHFFTGVYSFSFCRYSLGSDLGRTFAVV